MVGIATNARAQAPDFDLNQFQPAQLATDGFAVETADDLGHLRFGAQFYLDFARDPLVFRNSAGVETQVVHKQFTGHLQLHLGLIDRVVAFASLPLHMVMKEDAGDPAVSAVPFPTGGGMGDLALGARVRAWGTRDDRIQLAGQLTLSINSASLIDGNQVYSGGRDGSPFMTLFPELIATFNFFDGDLRLSANVGFQVRKNATLRNVQVGDEMTFALGGIYRAWTRETHAVDAILEVFGRTGLQEFGGKAESPIQMMLGGKYHHKELGLTAGMGGSMSFSKGYGAADFRITMMVGYTLPDSNDRSAAKNHLPPEEPALNTAQVRSADATDDPDVFTFPKLSARSNEVRR